MQAKTGKEQARNNPDAATILTKTGRSKDMWICILSSAYGVPAKIYTPSKCFMKSMDDKALVGMIYDLNHSIEITQLGLGFFHAELEKRQREHRRRSSSSYPMSSSSQ